jgi:pullulanase/glycogen debranching enzyme
VAEERITFVTCHDCFTLNDLVAYNHKHNEANDTRRGHSSEMMNVPFFSRAPANAYCGSLQKSS